MDNASARTDSYPDQHADPDPRVGVNESTARKKDIIRANSKDKLAIWYFLGGEVILFGALILTFIVFRIIHPTDFPAFRSHLSIPLIGANTLVLVLSSYFVVRTLEAAKKDRARSVIPNLLTVMSLGTLFIIGQAFEWSTLLGEGIQLDNTFGSPFYLMTGVHGTHVLIGLAWASIVLIFGLIRPYNRRNYRAIEFFGLYWHFVDIVWIVLFSLIYLI